MTVSSTDQMEELMGIATAFLRDMKDEKQEETMKVGEEWAGEVLKKLQKHGCCGGKAEAGAANMPVGDSAVGITYWVGQKALPSLTEEEVALAVHRLSQEERRKLAEEFDALQEERFELLCESEADLAHVEETAAERKTESPDGSGERRDEDDYIVMTSNKSDGRSMFFGGTLLELSYDNDAWPLSTQREVCAMTMDNHDMSPQHMPRFDTPTMDGPDTVAVSTFAASASASAAKLRPVPSCAISGCNTPSYNTKLEDYIRDRVRMMLLANRVTKDVEGDIIGAVLGAAEEVMQERERGLQLLLERRTESLRKAVQVAQMLQVLHRQAIGEYVKDPYLMQTWQRNEAAQVCQRCQRRFNLFVMRHHCRRCGLIFCQRCSSYAGILPDRKAEQYVASSWLRLCQDCYEICCEYQKRLITTLPPPRGRCERESRAPETPFSILFSNHSNFNGVLEDKLPPFYVVLPEEWYTVKAATASGWLNSFMKVPYLLSENFHDGLSFLSQLTAPGMRRLLSTTTDTIKRLKE
ncbi:putative zinc finger protein [Trypanosoma rangeli]|uniref:Putative zinc finger protein n=1 Tax=Trypanosoma rangeli TaxID=5698 RepID=A0A422NZM6_TRYRA|nr:putative zinc finger protein [Trypanosoma rangeli]RNF10962.1 putative zinc finger protein [Trypanosoma rangeli]|eukprot:RNF10962.1 putative zinc finger protein [Trypanosoma rangeli]